MFDLRRRDFITLIGGAAATSLLPRPPVARAQRPERARRIGIVMPFAQGDPEYVARVRVLREELARLGWSEGVNVHFDERWTTDNMDQVRAEAASLSASRPDVIVAMGGRVVPVLMQMSRSIPIVVPIAGDPVGIGWVKSLAKPGGNVTGFTFIEMSVFGKMLDVLKQISPATAAVGFIYNPDNPSTVVYTRAFEAAAIPLAIEPILVPIHGLGDIERALANLADRKNAGIFCAPDITIQNLREEVIALVGRHHLPAIYSDPSFPKVGGLAFYGADRVEMFRKAAGYVDRVLKGEKPGDLPFQQPTKYQFVINLRTAKVLGLTISPSVLALADEVIE